jgi:hypothetical protein
MAGITDAERQAMYDADCGIVNSIADNRIKKIQSEHDVWDKKTQAIVDKKIAAKEVLRDKRKATIKKEWDQKLRSVRPGFEHKIPWINDRYKGETDSVDEEYEAWFNDAAEDQYHEDGERLSKLDKAKEAVEMWRAKELASELHQLQTKHQRPRRR